jgi:IS30 family transposase
MLKKENYRMIEVLKKRGVYLKDIAEEVWVHPKTVQRARKRGGAPLKER